MFWTGTSYNNVRSWCPCLKKSSWHSFDLENRESAESDTKCVMMMLLMLWVFHSLPLSLSVKCKAYGFVLKKYNNNGKVNPFAQMCCLLWFTTTDAHTHMLQLMETLFLFVLLDWYDLLVPIVSSGENSRNIQLFDLVHYMTILTEIGTKPKRKKNRTQFGKSEVCFQKCKCVETWYGNPPFLHQNSVLQTLKRKRKEKTNHRTNTVSFVYTKIVFEINKISDLMIRL